MNEYFYVVLLLILGVPAGYWIAWMCRDELVQGRKWFLTLMVISVIFSIISLFFLEFSYFFSCLFIAIISGVSYWKSFDKNWTRRR